VQRWLELVDDPWLDVRNEAVLGELARVERRFDDAVVHLGRAAETSRRLGFLQTEAYQLTSLGRAQCQAGDYEAGAATLKLGIAKAEATGDVRLAALGRVHLGRILRGLERSAEARAALEAAAEFHEAAGGGEQQVLGDTLLAALERDREDLAVLLERARRDGDAPAEVFALDALALLTGDNDLYTAADKRMETASHFITERDRVDRRAD
jgi:tetratricopeptide (TPR) repeat protein